MALACVMVVQVAVRDHAREVLVLKFIDGLEHGEDVLLIDGGGPVCCLDHHQHHGYGITTYCVLEHHGPLGKRDVFVVQSRRVDQSDVANAQLTEALSHTFSAVAYFEAYLSCKLVHQAALADAKRAQHHYCWILVAN